jgi:L-alanine-DL-glutamate epimerase-like enolase superfamily enzyme
MIEVKRGDLVGYGEFAPNKRYSETVETVDASLKKFDSNNLSNPFDLYELHSHLNELYPHEGSVRAGIEMAYADLLGKHLNVPLHRLWNAPSQIGPTTSFTIGIDTEEIIRQKVEEAAPYPVLKVKLGTDHDKDIISIVRDCTDKELWIDANEGWTHPDTALDHVHFMYKKGVTLIEQPMPSFMIEELIDLKAVSPLPLIADEGFTGTEPMQDIARAYHGINLKLMKTGGMIPAFQHVWKAREFGLKVMVGCMIESSLANTAAAIVALWADYCDLDSHILISEDPFEGLKVSVDGRVQLNDLPGLGVSIR